MSKSTEADQLFKRLDVELSENIRTQYFYEPREFRSLIEVLAVLGPKADQIINTSEEDDTDLLEILKDRNPAYSELLRQRKIVDDVVDDVVTFEHCGLNNSVDTMGEVVREYSRGREDIRALRKALFETKSVLTARKSGQIPLKELWLKKVELEESLRMVKELETLKSTPHRVQRLMQQKHYLTAVMSLTRAIATMFSEDLVGVTGLSAVRESLMDLKEQMLETCVAELREAVMGGSADMLRVQGYSSDSDSEDEGTIDNRSRSDSVHSHVTGMSARSGMTGMTGMTGLSNAAGGTYRPLNIPGAAHMNTGSSMANSRIGANRVGGGEREPVGSRYASSLGGGARQLGGASAKGSWATDLRGIDEALEASLPDPSAAGGLYIRLLVRTVGVLELEEDVERMVLDSISKSFRVSCVRKLRESASLHLAKALAKERQRAGATVGRGTGGGGGKEVLTAEQEFAVHSKLFTAYMSSLLDASLTTIRRLFYLLKLLNLCKAQRIHAAAAAAAATAAAGASHHRTHHGSSSASSVSSAGSSTIRSGASGTSGTTHATRSDASSRRDSATPWGAGMGMSLPRSAATAAAAEAAAAAAVGIAKAGVTDADRQIKDSHKRQIVQVWFEMQDAVVQQMQAHLVEPDVQDITDQPALSRSSSFRLDNGAWGGRSPRHAGGSPRAGDLGGAGGGWLNRRVSAFACGSLDMDAEDGSGEVSVIFKPSVRHAAPLYRRIVLFHTMVHNVMSEHAIDDARFSLVPTASTRNIGSGGIDEDGWKSITPSGNNDALPGSAAFGANSDGELERGTPILEVIQMCLEKELIPVIQSNVNHGMREIQLNSQHFSVLRSADAVLLTATTGRTGAGADAGVGKGFTAKGSGRFSADTAAGGRAASASAMAPGNGDGSNSDGSAPLCYAATLCATASKPLFAYWLQLTEHRGMVSTVLDRLVRGFGAAAREELETLSYTLLSAEKKILSAVSKTLRSDPLFHIYRAEMYGIGRITVEDLFAPLGGGASSSGSWTGGGRSGGSRSGSRSDSAATHAIAQAAASAMDAAAAGRRSINSSARSRLPSTGGGGGGGGDETSSPGVQLSLEEARWMQFRHYMEAEQTAWGTYWNVGDPNYPITSQRIVTDFDAIGTIASISFGCDWVVKRLSSFTAVTMRKLSSTMPSSAGSNSPSNRGTAGSTGGGPSGSSALAGVGGFSSGGGGSGGGGGLRGTMLRKTSRQELNELRASLAASVTSAARQLGRIAEEGFALLRGELQVISFYFLYRLAHIEYVLPNTLSGDSTSGGGSGGSGSKQLHSASSFTSTGASAANLHSGSSAAGSADSVVGTAEEEAILGSFSAHLGAFFDAVLGSSSAHVLATVFAPLCSLVPRLLIRCTMHMVTNPHDARGSLARLSGKQQKAHLLRIVVIIQQSVALHIQALPFAPETRRRLMDRLTEAFEHARRFITLLDMPASELKAYLVKNCNEYVQEETEVLWKKSPDTKETFSALWKQIESARSQLS